jgi:lysophospholipase L1-like esterase
MPDDLTPLRALSRRRLLRAAALSAGAISAGAVSAGAVAAPLLRPGHPATQAASNATSAPAQHWVGSWTASPTDAVTPFDGAGRPLPAVLADQTLRMIVTPHLGGSVLRIHFSNRFGSSAARFGRVTVGLQETLGAASAVTPVTFNGQPQITVPAGQDVTSDPVPLAFGAFSPLAISMYVPGSQSAPTKHWVANATSFYASPGSGDLSGTASGGPFGHRTESWLYVDGVDVQAGPDVSAIVAFGDSITDGFVAATPFSVPTSMAVADSNRRYPDDLQRRLIDAGIPLSMVNAGISGNRVVTDTEPAPVGPSGVQRFQRDALDVAGVRGVLFQEGINDLGVPPATTTPAQLIAGYQQIIGMAHAAGLKIWMGTLLPASKAFFDGTATAPHSEAYREQVNAWIRSQHIADGVVDFDAALRDPSDPHVLNPQYASADHLHPNLAGYQVMADTVSLTMLKSAL